MGSFLPLLLNLFVAAGGVLGFNPERNRFLNPAPGGRNPVWLIGEQQVISWKTEFTVYNISIWHQYPTNDGATFGSVLYSASSRDAPTNFTWTVQTYDFDLSFSNVFFFWFNRGAPKHFISHYFNITTDESITSTRSISTTSDQTGISITVPSTTTPSPSDATIEPQAAEGLNSNAKVGLGVGVGIGVPIILLLAFVAFGRYFRRPKPSYHESFQPHMREVPRRPQQEVAELASKHNANESDNFVELDGSATQEMQDTHYK
ncbi:uncharacterized protein CIMG_01486 [Coccidioides immitis RS]|uniref:Mid2 domain-containing protein n=4 Tax=Coccidioides immitis TaxID=5501 RepID=J3KJB2_COCIM|nr:uncharacterized protein CIMG_01486 [Coccidioides immitis RS]KMP01452.1 hypothetical protein CIRG_01592 [Coccidioides immitis RMSCC 2394]KMU77283.1 hypothetical protein CISG_06324 [Coccidioides immitis RMSCC 3703]KMU88898.1 hypothetical protein CIHG_06700 [Coccidioides immitis H538.4]TPX25707.1 hypothetical protein DIZ76_011163 [Coccidioides immitis]EAS36132.3 hypothetical protein CIMG_01486 [Coccidioides immitis RS]